MRSLLLLVFLVAVTMAAQLLCQQGQIVVQARPCKSEDKCCTFKKGFLDKKKGTYAHDQWGCSSKCPDFRGKNVVHDYISRITYCTGVVGPCKCVGQCIK